MLDGVRIRSGIVAAFGVFCLSVEGNLMEFRSIMKKCLF